MEEAKAGPLNRMSYMEWQKYKDSVRIRINIELDIANLQDKSEVVRTAVKSLKKLEAASKNTDPSTSVLRGEDEK